MEFFMTPDSHEGRPIARNTSRRARRVRFVFSETNGARPACYRAVLESLPTRS